MVDSLALLALMAGDQDDHQTAAALAARAAETAEVQGLTAEPLSGIVHLAKGRVLLRQGKLAEAEERLGRALELFGIDSHGRAPRPWRCCCSPRSATLPATPLALAALLEETRELIDGFADPGVLPALLEQTEQTLGARRPAAGSRWSSRSPNGSWRSCGCSPPGCRTGRSAAQLYVSINTVRTHIQAVYRKLGVATRAEAVTQARELGLLPKA